MERVAAATVFGRSPLGACVRMSEWIWSRMPPSLTGLRPVTAYGRWLHRLVGQGDRRQYFGTFFLRNRPELELIARLVDRASGPAPVRIAVLGCSIGTEVYSIQWAMRTARPDARAVLRAVDISSEAVAVGRQGVYAQGRDALAEEPVCAFMTADEMAGLFDAEGTTLRVKAWLRQGIVWEVGDAADPRILGALGPQDIVVANRFLCHMAPREAEACLRNIARLVDPGGHLFVSGIDLDVRAKVAADLGWAPVRDRMAEIHDGDRTLRQSWPCRYWGLEPLDRARKDWELRYASVFQVGARA
jgi:SAM-dependent methyltransferase